MECVDSGMVLLMDPVAALQDDAGGITVDSRVASLLAVTEAYGVLKRVLEQAYGDATTVAVKII